MGDARYRAHICFVWSCCTATALRTRNITTTGRLSSQCWITCPLVTLILLGSGFLISLWTVPTHPGCLPSFTYFSECSLNVSCSTTAHCATVPQWGKAIWANEQLNICLHHVPLPSCRPACCRKGRISQTKASEEQRGGQGKQPWLCSIASSSRENWHFPRVRACVFICFQLMLCLSGFYVSRWSLEVFKLYLFGMWLSPITHISVAASWNFSLLVSLPFILFPVCSKPLFLLLSLSLLVASYLHPSIPHPSAPFLLMQNNPSPGVSAPMLSCCQQEWQSSLTLESIHNA